MKIAVVHSFYDSSLASGETLAVEAQVAALERGGHEVLLVARRTDDEKRNPLFALKAAATVATGFGADPTKQLADFRPDVVHVHNWFPNFGTRWLTRWQGPVAVTVHNFRPMCAAATLYRDGALCTACPDGSSFEAVRYGCYRGSRIATIPLAVRTRNGAAGDPVLTRSDRIVCLSTRSASIYRGYGIAPQKIEVIPNFVAAAGAQSTRSRQGWLYAGRLTAEKGVLELIDVWPASETLDIVGSGPLAAAVGRSGGNIRYLGPRHATEVVGLMGNYEGVVIPSLCTEGAMTNVLLEALSAGLPVVAARTNTAADEVMRLSVGAVYEPTDAVQLARALDSVRADPTIGDRCVASSRLFSESVWLDHTERMYRQLVTESRR